MPIRWALNRLRLVVAMIGVVTEYLRWERRARYFRTRSTDQGDGLLPHLRPELIPAMKDLAAWHSRRAEEIRAAPTFDAEAERRNMRGLEPNESANYEDDFTDQHDAERGRYGPLARLDTPPGELRLKALDSIEFGIANSHYPSRYQRDVKPTPPSPKGRGGRP